MEGLSLYAVVSLLIIAALSLIIGRLAAIALTVTGVPREIARFQARSALTGAGFTTAESESIVNHPVRRRIVMNLMLLGSLGTVAVIAGAIGSVVGISGWGSGLRRALLLLGGLVMIVIMSRTPTFDRVMSRLLAGVVKRTTNVDIRDYAKLLHLSGEYGVSELYVGPGDWLADTSLEELDLPHEGVLVLGIVRSDGSYVGAPTGRSMAHEGDTVIVYGRVPVLMELDQRRAGESGDRAHQVSTVQQRQQQAQDDQEST